MADQYPLDYEQEEKLPNVECPLEGAVRLEFVPLSTRGLCYLDISRSNVFPGLLVSALQLLDFFQLGSDFVLIDWFWLWLRL